MQGGKGKKPYVKEPATCASRCMTYYTIDLGNLLLKTEVLDDTTVFTRRNYPGGLKLTWACLGWVNRI